MYINNPHFELMAYLTRPVLIYPYRFLLGDGNLMFEFKNLLQNALVSHKYAKNNLLVRISQSMNACFRHRLLLFADTVNSSYKMCLVRVNFKENLCCNVVFRRHSFYIVILCILLPDIVSYVYNVNKISETCMGINVLSGYLTYICTLL